MRAASATHVTRRGPRRLGAGRLIAAVLLAGVSALLLWAIGFPPVNAALLAAAVLTAVILLGLTGDTGHAGWPALREPTRGGYRSDVSNLAAVLVDRDGRLAERALRTLRHNAEERLRAHGIDATAPAAVDGALGDGAWRTLHPPTDTWPTLRAATRCLAALEKLGPASTPALHQLARPEDDE